MYNVGVDRDCNLGYFNKGLNFKVHYLLYSLREDIFIDNYADYVNNKAAGYNKEKDDTE